MSALTKKQLEDVVTGLNQRLDGLLSKITALESMPARLTHLEALLEAAALENANLRQSLEAKDTTINGMLLKMNSLEQYNRSWSIRINGLAVTSEEEKDSDLVKRKVYDNLLLPILQGAVEQGDLTDVPPCRTSPGSCPRAACGSRRQDQAEHRQIFYSRHLRPCVPPQEGLRAQGGGHHGRQTQPLRLSVH